MREIKFRAWYKPEGYMVQVHELAYDGIGCIDDYFVDDEYLFMQYTGLKDEDGVEIYEGDIVRWRSRFNEDREHLDVVEWSDLGAWLLMPFCHEPHQALMKVVGNIHEYSGLLNKSCDG